MAKYNSEDIKKIQIPTIPQFKAWLASLRKSLYSQRPWPHFSKKGPGRKHSEFTAGQRAEEKKKAGAYGRGLTNWRNGKLSKGRV